MRSLFVRRAGLLTTVQDEGRWGYQAYGVPVSGAMDAWSHRLANVLVGNARGAATLEVTGSGPALTVSETACVAVTGAQFRGELDGVPWTSPVVLDVRKGAELTFGGRLAGMRAYLAVNGGVDVPPVLGSRATDVRSGLGGIGGRPVRDGDTLPVGEAPHRPARARVPEDAGWMLTGGTARLHVVPGPERGAAADRAYEALLGSTFIVSSRSDRMGYHLAGARVPIDAAPRLSAPVATGVIQVPPSGEPVLLMADRQTTGGYAAVAAVIAADLPIAGQLGPGDSVRFEPCEAPAALRHLIAREQVLLAAGVR